MNFKEHIQFEQDVKGFLSLMESEDLGSEYAMNILGNFEKIATYLIKTKLKNAADLDRFKKFISMVEKEIPKLSKACEAITKEINNADVTRYSYYK